MFNFLPADKSSDDCRSLEQLAEAMRIKGPVSDGIA